MDTRTALPQVFLVTEDQAQQEPGDMLILPAQTACRAYRWPREAEQATIFLAIYPQQAAQSHQ